ncbi:MAG: histidinol-phosphate aminotransferase [Sulfuricurvum sp. PC08-66]|nr:MAG: histidinol-phosphate aminotransferase [Sulfuricurvum sp. PC08-66]
MQFNSVLESLDIYEAGKPIELVVREYGINPKDVVKLASNENPFGCSPKVQAKIAEILPKMALYPDDSMYELKEALAAKYSVNTRQVIIGAGSDQIIEFAVHAKLGRGQKVLMNGVTFAMYEIYAKHVGATILKTTSREHDLGQFLALYKEHKPEMIFICTPNNPTGDALDKTQLYDFLDQIDANTLVVVDGAYMEYTAYADPKKAVMVDDITSRYANVLYLGTFSKAYGLGGMRVGYGIGARNIIEALYKIRPPFNITTLSLQAAIEALKDEAFVLMSLKNNFEEIERYYDFAKEVGFEAIPSYTNFVTLLLPSTQSSKKVAQTLLEKGMIVRDLTGYGLNAIRVTIGTLEQNSQFFERFMQYCR